MTTSTTFLCTFSLLLRVVIGNTENLFETVFSIPNPLTNFPLRTIEFDPQTDDIFVSGKNVLFKLLKEDNYGKVITTSIDTNCFTEPERQKYCVDDENSVMIVTPNYLITCSTWKGGLCRKRNKMTMNNTLPESNVGLVSDIDKSAVGQLITVNLKISSTLRRNESRLLFAKSYTSLPSNIEDQMDKTAIFSVPADLPIKSTSSSLGKENLFDMVLEEGIVNKVKMEYKALLENDEFVFLLFNQNSKAKIAKICKSVDAEEPKKVYEDIPVYCDKDGTNFTQIEHGTFVTYLGSRYLVALLSDPEKSTAAVCVFKETEIYNGFLESRRHRYGCPDKHPLSSNDAIFGQMEDNTNCVPWRSMTKENEVIVCLTNIKCIHEGFLNS
jgi:hypothetical protein